MNNCLKGLFFLLCFFSSTGLTAADHIDSSIPKYQAKLYFVSNDLEISENAIYIHLEEMLIETSTIRTDQQGFYIFEDDIINYEAEKEKMWKCPYCYHWWPVGQRCQNPECPTNQWE